MNTINTEGLTTEQVEELVALMQATLGLTERALELVEDEEDDEE
jgi:hypothetical protein